jgi:cystathionine beta-lyase/cystathionine gamma-synthase
MDKRAKWNINTRLNHPKKPEMVSGNTPTLTPIYQTAKFVLSAEHPYWDQYIYTRISNPTLRQLESTLAEIQKKEDCIVYGSGIAAITGVMLALLKQGDHMISFRETYRPARIFFRDLLPNFGIESSILKLNDLGQLERTIVPGKTKLIHFESPSNPNLSIADINAIITIAKKHNVLVSMDGTFAGLHQHTEFPVDIMIQSLTKFGNGHGDVISGAVAGSKTLIQKIRSMSVMLGATLDPHAAFLVDRGLKTYMLRYKRQTETSQQIAQFLSAHPKVKKVFYPDGELARSQMKDMGAMVSFVLDPSVGKATEFCHKLNLIQFAVSLGSTETLICPSLNFFGEDLTSQDRLEMGIDEYSLRLSVGLEDAVDLIAELESALSVP